MNNKTNIGKKLLSVAVLGSYGWFLYNAKRFVGEMAMYKYAIVLMAIIALMFILVHIMKERYIANKAISIIYWFFVGLAFMTFTLNAGILYVDHLAGKLRDNRAYYSSSIIVLNDSKYHKLTDLNGAKIGFNENASDYENHILPAYMLEKINYNEYLYAENTLGIMDLINGKIDALGISSNYKELYSEYFVGRKFDELMRVIEVKQYKKKKVIVREPSLKTNQPFNILFIGADSMGEKFNADSLILTSINPVKNKVIMVDVVRDTYTLNKCSNIMEKITHIGSGDDVYCGLETVSNLFNNLEVNYYVKLNFHGLKDLVDLIGGVTIDVPYDFHAFTETDTYIVERGLRKLNGYEALALARTRKLPETSLYSRGEMQMAILEAVMKQADMSVLVSQFFDLFQVISTNVKTNLNTNDIYLYLQKYLQLKDTTVFERYALEGEEGSYYSASFNANLFTVRPAQESIDNLSNILKENLTN